VYLASISLSQDFSDEYAKYFENGFPARATVEIELMLDAFVEISVVAYKP
jgi:enamine deaminase RidA (YjgF/YER057c/UK114 family)